MLKPKRQTTSKKSGEPGWMWRRWVIFPTIAFCGWQLHLMRDAADTQLNAVLASGYLWTIVGCIVIYSGFATFQDIAAIWVTRSGRPYAAEQQPEPADREDIPEPPPEKVDPTKPPSGFAE